MYADFRLWIQLDCLAFFKPELHINASIAYQCKAPLIVLPETQWRRLCACKYLNSISCVCASGNVGKDDNVMMQTQDGSAQEIIRL